MSLIKTIKNTKLYKRAKKEKDDFLTRQMVKQNKKTEYERRLKLYEESKDFKYDLLDYRNIVKERPDCDREYTAYNGFYGISHIIKRYSGYKGLVHPIIQHYADLDYDTHSEFDISNNKIGMVCAKRVAERIEKITNKTILAIGPSILYARPVLSDSEIQNIKKELGKTLLIFPSHSLEEWVRDSDDDAFSKYVEDIKKQYGFNTVLVSMYFVDIEKHEGEIVTKDNYKVVSSGHRNSRDFLDIQRTLMELSDGVLAQGYTSGVAYAVSLNKPVGVYREHAEFHKIGSPDEIFHMGDKTETYNKFFDVFSDYNDTISDEQREYADYLWGISKKRSPEEMYKLLELSEKIDKASGKKQEKLLSEIKKYV